jgi:hypothetical protein
MENRAHRASFSIAQYPLIMHAGCDIKNSAPPKEVTRKRRGSGAQMARKWRDDYFLYSNALLHRCNNRSRTSIQCHRWHNSQEVLCKQHCEAINPDRLISAASTPVRPFSFRIGLPCFAISIVRIEKFAQFQ